MTHPRFFGFGSLVNTRTHIYPNPVPAQATGWERVWVQSADHPFAFLSIRAAPGSTIAGLVCDVPNGDWAALDLREAGYTRAEIAADLGLPSPIAAYMTPDLAPASDAARPILLSYLDVVAQGFGDWYGTEGVRAFFATTTGWDVPVLDDRAAPRYPRHQDVPSTERAAVNAQLEALRAEVITA